MGVTVKVKNNNIDGAISFFSSQVKKYGILDEYKEKRFYTKPSEKRRLKLKKAKYNQRKDG